MGFLRQRHFDLARCLAQKSVKRRDRDINTFFSFCFNANKPF